MQLVADPPADQTVAEIVGPWPPIPGGSPSANAAAAHPAAAACLDRIAELNKIIRGWKDNRDVATWAPGPQTPPGFGAPLARYVTLAAGLPAWADRDRLKRAEAFFMDYGALSVTILFCASLPECYVVPDLASVLQATGQLEYHADHRIRTTGAMIFPLMMKGGLTSTEGSGIAQVLKVRLIHATVRNLLLRKSPAEAVANPVPMAPLAPIQFKDRLHPALLVHGWDPSRLGLPSNQEELAYTLLTFSYVFLRSMRRLGIPLEREAEKDYLHLWNVGGHFLGIDRSLMADTMEDAQELFTRMQARGREDWATRPLPVDPRPRLGAALMEALESAIPPGTFRWFPTLFARYLLEPASRRDLGLEGRVPWRARALFATIMAAAQGLDAMVRLVVPHFSMCRLIARVIGYRLTCALLMSQTCDLSVPDHLRPGIIDLIGRWKDDKQASARMNALEDRYTTRGMWTALARKPPHGSECA